MSEIKKRFIAGATCPKCQAMDKIVVYQKDDAEYRECVDCGFEETMRFQQHARELQTRVNTPAETIAEETQVLQFPPKS